MTVENVKNYIDGQWVESESSEFLDVINPATTEIIAKVPLSTTKEVEAAIQAAKAAFKEWRETPPLQRVRYLFTLRDLMEDNFEDLARTIVIEEGKTIDEARGEIRRGIENVEVATGIPTLMQGTVLEDIARSIDEIAIRQPIGVCCMIPPFNFPSMVSLWFLPYAVACGNTYIVKPSERVPLSQNRLFQLMDEAEFPEGVVNLVNGAKGVVDQLLESPTVRAVSFVGSTPVAKAVYEKATANGKRAQCQAGAKNFIVVMPDAILDPTVSALMTSFFGCAGERCLSGAVLLAVGDGHQALRDKLVDTASKIRVGYGLEEGIQMGPVISKPHMERVLGYIKSGEEEGAELLLDGRGIKVEEYPNGYFIGPTIFDKVKPEMAIAKDEIFGPVMSIIQVNDFEEALSIIDASPYGNASSIFTANGKVARDFQYRVKCGNIGINVGIAAPMAFFPFSGWKDSFFGDLHGQGHDAVRFFTDQKVVITRWF